MAERRAFDPETLLAEVKACTGFYTCLPVSAVVPSFAAVQWAAPLAGTLVGLLVGLVLLVGLLLGLPATVAAAVALSAGIALTGALHEDGLADVADGFGGGRSCEDKLTNMRDSRIGTYGTLALATTLLMRWSALAALASTGGGIAVVALVSAHAASRAIIPLFMLRVPAARSDGLSANAGAASHETALVAVLIGAALTLFCGIGFAVLAAILLGIWSIALERLARQQIGGQTGDVLGALQQGGEVLILVAASAVLV